MKEQNGSLLPALVFIAGSLAISFLCIYGVAV